MGDVIDLQDHIPHHMFEAVCIKCFHRWIALVPKLIILKTLDCASCGERGYVIDTGQYIETVDYGEKNDPETVC